MRARFVTQPYTGGEALLGVLRTCLGSADLTRLDVAVAWVKRSGIRLIETDVRQFHARGGHVRLVVGVSEGGATAQGLCLARDLADEAYVFHVPGRTFHPKVYVLSGPMRATVIVGSHNLTRGGAVENFEAATVVELSLSRRDDRAYLQEVISYIDGLVADTTVCRRLDVTTLAVLVKDPRYRVADEDARRAASDSVQGGDTRKTSMFGRSRHVLQSAPTSGSRTSGRTGRRSPPAGGGQSMPRGGSTASVPRQPTVVHRWFKQIPRADAQRLAGTSSPSGHVTLTKARHPIDQATHFRRTFFSRANWRRVSGRRERATIQVDVQVLGRDFGTQQMEVDHNPAFDAGQRNRTTTLRWGLLNQYLRRSVDITDHWLTLEALSNGRYRLVVDQAPTGSFIP